MWLYDVTVKSERTKCFQKLEKDLVEDPEPKKVICIMGGDGSLATTITFFRTSKVIDMHLQKGNISFVTLPFGTGNDTS